MKINSLGAFKFSNYGMNGSVDNNKHEIKFLDEIAYKNHIFFCKFSQDEIEAIDKLVQRYDSQTSNNLEEFKFAFGIEPYTLAVTIFDNIRALNNKIKTEKITHNSKLLVQNRATNIVNAMREMERNGIYNYIGRMEQIRLYCIRLAKQKNDEDIYIPIYAVDILHHLDNKVTNAEAANIFTKLLLPTMQMRTNFEDNRNFSNMEVHQLHNYQREIYAR